jgi:hypothetical protein
MANGDRIMPQTVEEIFTPLRDNLIHLLNRWAVYQRVFGRDEQTIHLLNRFSGVFFRNADWAMYLDVVLDLCRLTDPAESAPNKPGHRPNHTLERLVHEVDKLDSLGTSLKSNELVAIDNLRKTHFEEVRSKRIAHNDLAKMQTRHDGHPTIWPGPEKVKEMLSLCRRVMEKVHEHFVGCPLTFNGLEEPMGEDAERLLHALQEFAERHDEDVIAGKRLPLIGLPPAAKWST